MRKKGVQVEGWFLQLILACGCWVVEWLGVAGRATQNPKTNSSCLLVAKTNKQLFFETSRIA